MFFVLLIVILIILVKNNTSYILDYLNHGSGINTLDATLEAEKKKNEYLKQKLYVVKTDEFVENEARKKLGMLKEGEFFVIAPTGTPEKKEEIDETLSNWRKWLELFF